MINWESTANLCLTGINYHMVVIDSRVVCIVLYLNSVVFQYLNYTYIHYLFFFHRCGLNPQFVSVLSAVSVPTCRPSPPVCTSLTTWLYPFSPFCLLYAPGCISSSVPSLCDVVTTSLFFCDFYFLWLVLRVSLFWLLVTELLISSVLWQPSLAHTLLDLLWAPYLVGFWHSHIHMGTVNTWIVWICKSA